MNFPLYNERFLNYIRQVKAEIQGGFLEMYKKENDIEDFKYQEKCLYIEIERFEVDVLLKIVEQNNLVSDLDKNLELVMQEKATNPKNVFIDLNIELLTYRIADLKSRYINPFVQINFNKHFLRNFCTVELFYSKPFKYRKFPQWSQKISEDRCDQIYSALLAVHPLTGNIYVNITLWSRSTPCEILILSPDGEFLTTIPLPIKIVPLSICFDGDHIYISSETHKEIFKLNHNGDLESSIQTNFQHVILLDSIHPNGVNKLFVYSPQNAFIGVIIIPQLRISSSINLKYPQSAIHTRGGGAYYIQTLRTSYKEIFVLNFTQILSFDFDGGFIKFFLPNNSLQDSFYFSIDANLNFIVSDGGNGTIKIFDRHGQLIDSIGKSDDSTGTIDSRYELCVDLFNRIIIINRNNDLLLEVY